jgi:hypothetical protein
LCRKTSPGPANLNVVIATAQAVTSANRPLPPSKKARNQHHLDTSETTDPASVNAVVHLLEKGCGSSKKKWQCRHCSYIQADVKSMSEGGKCEFCLLAMVSLAPDNAVVSPSILRHALSTRDNVSSILQPAASKSATASTTTTQSTLLFSPTSTQQRQRPYPRPDVWPRGKRCCICESVGVDKYCSCCK